MTTGQKLARAFRPFLFRSQVTATDVDLTEQDIAKAIDRAMSETTIQISLIQLRNLLEVATLAGHNNEDLSGVVSIKRTKETDSHTGTDKLEFRGISKYAECNSQFLGTN